MQYNECEMIFAWMAYLHFYAHPKLIMCLINTFLCIIFIKYNFNDLRIYIIIFQVLLSHLVWHEIMLVNFTVHGLELNEFI